jgi:DNA-binding transcriptional LysR family regulator
MSGTTISPQALRRMRRLSLRQLIYFTELQQQGGFSRAAEALGISQPTLSQQIAQLEETLGVSLIQRGNKVLKLTDEGELFLSQLRRVLATLGDAIDKLDGERRSKILRIGIPNYMSYPVVTNLLREFRRRQPEALLYLAEMTAEEMSQFLNERELDVGFMTLPTPSRLNGDMESLTVWEAPYCICLSRRHDLAVKAVLRATDLAKLDFILVPRDYHRNHYDHQVEMLKAFGITPQIVHTDVSTTQSQMALASAGLGGCLLSPATISISDDLVLKETEPRLGSHTLELFWSVANRNPLVEQFCNCARAFTSAGRPRR